MKRNRLVRQPRHQAIFSNAPQLLRIRYVAVAFLVALSAFVLMGFFSSEPASADYQSSIIDLPGLPASEQAAESLPTTTTMLALAKPASPESIPQEDNALAQHDNASVVDELNAVENLHNVTVETELEQIAESTLAIDWQQIKVKSGDNLSLIFDRAGLSPRDVYDITQLDKKTIAPLFTLKPGQIIHLATSIFDNNKTVFEGLKIILSPIETFYIHKDDSDIAYRAETVTRELDIRHQQVIGEIETSLFGSGLAAGLSDKVVMELAYIFGWDIDFALDLRTGDKFKLIYEEQFLDGEKIGDGNIIAAEFTNRGSTFRAIRFTDDNGDSNYYSPEGDSMRKTFTRTPVPLSRISSRFNPNRKHPILQTNRPHRGVDYAAKTGTPILATGDGKVQFLGRKGGYGRTIILSHSGKYTTLYAHMSRYKKGLRSGHRVKQGQIIGYVGSSGMATGPHLHYEFRVNGVHRNPLTVALPKAEPLAKRYHTAFTTQAKPYLAQLDAMQDTVFAQSE